MISLFTVDAVILDQSFMLSSLCGLRWLTDGDLSVSAEISVSLSICSQLCSAELAQLVLV